MLNKYSKIIITLIIIIGILYAYRWYFVLSIILAILFQWNILVSFVVTFLAISLGVPIKYMIENKIIETKNEKRNDSRVANKK
jgi:predicted membrane protein